jgi:predicted AAA+ superfamily ATPase
MIPHNELETQQMFELSNRHNESLMERAFEYKLYPISFTKIANYHTLRAEKQLMPYRLIYGYYPDVMIHPEDAKKILQNLVQNFLYKNMLLEGVKKPDKIVKLLQALAFQVGSRISYNELSKTIGMNSTTIEKYITMLEKSFVLFRLSSFSRNLRSELSKSRKIYFYDNGIRNTLIGNFSSIEIRIDTGALWKNFLISERLKWLQNNERWAHRFFWRTNDRQEVDYVEEEDEVLSVFEFKWNKSSKARVCKTFLNSYPNVATNIITPDNHEIFINP